MGYKGIPANSGDYNITTAGIIASGIDSISIRNATGSTIGPYTAIKVSGDYSVLALPKVTPVTSTTDTPIAIIVRDIPDASIGIALKRGRWKTTLNTSLSSIGSKVYFNPGTGLLSLTSVAGILVGQVLTLEALGIVYFNLGASSGGGGSGTVMSVTGLNTDNTDPSNPIVEISVDGITVTGAGTPGSPLVANVSPVITSTQIGFGSAGNILTSSANLVWIDSTDILGVCGTSGNNFTLLGGTPSALDANGTSLYFTGGNATGTSGGGTITLTGGTGGPVGIGGNGAGILLQGGNAGGTSGSGGNVELLPGVKTGLGTNGTIQFYDPSNGFNAAFITTSLSANHSFTFPNRNIIFDNITTATTTNGTGFLKGNGTVISFDNSTYSTVAQSQQPWIDIYRQGFLNQLETTIGFNEGTYTFTLTDGGGGWSYYRTGLKHTISGNKTVVLPGSPPAAGIYFIYIDATDGTLTQSTIPWTLNDSKVCVSVISWNNALTPKSLLMEERHSCLIDLRDHMYLHDTRGTQTGTIGSLTGYTLNSDVDANKTFAISQSAIFDEDIYETLLALTQPNGTATNYTVFYRTAISTWAWKMSNMPFIYNVGNANNWIQWDNAGTMTDATGGTGANQRWLNSYLVLTNESTSSARFAIVPGRAIFTSLSAAQAEDPTTFDFTGVPYTEGVVVYQITWTTHSNSSSGRCVLAVAPKRVSVNITQTTGAVAGTLHNSLSGLQGGQAGEYYHLTSSEYTGTGTGIFSRQDSPVFTTNITTPIIQGSIAASGALTLESTFHATKGNINFGTSYYDEANNILNISKTNLLTTTVDGMALSNNTASDGVNTVQNSPVIRLRGTSWATGSGGASHTIDWQLYNQPITGSSSSGIFNIKYSLDGGVYTAPLILTSAGSLTTLDSINAGNYVQATVASIVTTSTDGVILNESSAALVGTPVQYSPRLRFTGRAWNTTPTAASNTINFINEVRPISGTTTSGSLFWAFDNNGAGYSDLMNLTSIGNLLLGTATDGMTAAGSLAIAKDLAHRGTYAGFYNTTPITKPSGNALTALSNLGLITTPTLTNTDVGLSNVTNNAQVTSVTGTANRISSSGTTTPTINLDTSLIPQPVAGDVGKVWQVTGANTSALTLISTNVIGTRKRLGIALDIDGVTNTVNTNYGLYTVGASTYAKNVKIYICNRNAGYTSRVRLAHIDGAVGAVANEDYILYDDYLLPYETKIVEIEGMITADTLLVRSNTSLVGFEAVGEELSVDIYRKRAAALDIDGVTNVVNTDYAVYTSDHATKVNIILCNRNSSYVANVQIAHIDNNLIVNIAPEDRKYFTLDVNQTLFLEMDIDMANAEIISLNSDTAGVNMLVYLAE